MHKHLILLAYKKARKERRKIGNNRPSKNTLAVDIATEIDYIIGPKSLKLYYDEAKKKETISDDININQLIVVNSLCRYLNYRDYEDFAASYKKEKEKDDDKPPVIILTHSEEKKESESVKKNEEEYLKNSIYRRFRFSVFNNKETLNKKMVIIINMIILLTVAVFISNNILSKNNERWMLWKEDHYTEVTFDITKYLNNDIEPYNKTKLDSFKKIDTPDCDTRYFNEKGEAITWYLKKTKNDLDVFTAPGRHPVNGKELKPMTRYMVRTHICENY